MTVRNGRATPAERRTLETIEKHRCRKISSAREVTKSEWGLVDRDRWADIMATHLETVQGRVRPAGRVD